MTETKAPRPRMSLPEDWFPRQEVAVNVGLNDVMTLGILILVIIHLFT